jgi:hypothetical protein
MKNANDLREAMDVNTISTITDLVKSALDYCKDDEIRRMLKQLTAEVSQSH